MTGDSETPVGARGVEQVGKDRQNLLADLTVYRIVIPTPEHVRPRTS